MFFGKKSTPPPPAPETAAPPAAPSPAGAPATSTAGAPAQGTAPVAAQPAAQAGPTAAPLSGEEARKRAAVAKSVAASFGEIVTLLMRSQSERKRPLQDLEWMIVPALMHGQFAVADAQSRETGAVMPVAAVLWAFVTPELDRKLGEAGEEAPRLATADWRSGDIPWIVLAIGDPKVVGGLLQQLSKTVFKDKPAKIRARGADGKVVVGRLERTDQAAG